MRRGEIVVGKTESMAQAHGIQVLSADEAGKGFGSELQDSAGGRVVLPF